jgi:hypothetical protein
MAIYYVDLENGLDANNGSTWALAKKTITNAATSRSAGDEIRVAKSPAPISIGNGTWQTSNGTAVNLNAISISSSTNTSPIVITSAANHGLTTGDITDIYGHTINYNANGAWVVNVLTPTTFELVGSVGVGVGGATGSLSSNAASKCVKLATSQNATISNCESLWTAAAGGDATISLVPGLTEGKKGFNNIKITLDAAVQINKLQAYFPTGNLNLSSYNGISFWIRSSSATGATAYVVTLCSDTAGATPVDTFAVPAITGSSTWVPITVMRTGGGTLGSSIQSIAISTGSTGPANGSNIQVDNFIACTTTGLSLQSLISKNGNETGGTESYYPIKSINLNVVILDNSTIAKTGEYRGYYSTTANETVTTYIRRGVYPVTASSSSTVVNGISSSGTSASNIIVSGGWNTSNTTQDGETLIDGLNTFGYGLNIGSGINNITISRLSFFRYNYGLMINGGYSITASVPHANGCGAGIFFNTGGYLCNISCNNAHNNYYYGLTVNTSVTGLNINLLNAFNNTVQNTSTYGNLTTLGSGGTFNNIKLANAYAGLRLFGPNNKFTNLETVYNKFRGIESSGANNFIYNLTANNNLNLDVSQEQNQYYTLLNIIGTTSAVSFSIGNVFSQSRIFVSKYNNDINNNQIAAPNLYVVSLTNTRPGGAGLMWKGLIGGGDNNSLLNPQEISLAKIAVTANNLVTFKIWCKKDNATTVGGRIVCHGNQIAGVPSDVIATKANDTNWEELTITFTPTEKGVVEIVGQAFTTGGNNTYVYFADQTITQA